MKKTLFLSAILGAALCSSAFAAVYPIVNLSSGEIKFGSPGKSLSQSQAGDEITLNVTHSGTGLGGAYFQQANATIRANLTINSLVFNNGFSGDYTYTFTGKISGSGPITRGNGQAQNKFLFKGDVSEYTGAITFGTASDATVSNANQLIFDATELQGGMTVNASSVTMTNKALLKTVGDVTFSNAITSGNTSIGDGHVTLHAASVGNLTLAEGAVVTVADGSTMTLGSSVNLLMDTAKKIGNGLGGAVVNRQIAGGSVNSGAVTSWMVNGNSYDTLSYNTETNTLSGTITTTTYYINDTSDTSLDLTGASTVEVNVDGDFAWGAKVATDITSMTINSGRVTTTGISGGNGIVGGDVVINAGAALAVLNGGDAFGWRNGEKGGDYTNNIILNGKDASHKATLELLGGGQTTMQTTLKLNGFAEISGNGSFNTFGGNVTVAGQNNSIAAGIALRKAVTLTVNNGASLDISGTITEHSEADGNTILTKNGGGVLNVSGTFNKGTLKVTDGTLIISGLQLVRGSQLRFENNEISTVTGAYLKGDVNGSAASLLTARLDATKLGDQVTLKAGSEQVLASMSTTGTNGEWLVVEGVGNTETGVYTDINMNSTSTVRNGLIIAKGGTAAHIGSLSGTASQTEVRGDWNTQTESTDRRLVVHQDTDSSFNGRFIKTNNADFSVALTKYGTGTLTLTNISETTKTLTVEEGGVTFSENGAWGGAIVANNKGIVTFDKDATINKSISGTGTLAVGSGHSLMVTGQSSMSIGGLTLSSGATLTLGTEANHNNTLTTSALTVEGNSTINANLVVTGNGTMDFSNHTELTMGCTVSIGDHVTIKIDETELASIVNTGAVLVIITDVEGVDTDNLALTLGSDWKFVDSHDQSLDAYNLRLDVVEAGNGKYNIVVAPEPATATLSLLALAALAARRKRH